MSATGEAGPIVLLTDFGTQDWFVGVMKGVVKRHWRPAELVDLCHEIEPQNIRHGEFVLSISRDWFPSGSIFCAVVDPGVGSERDPLIAFEPTRGQYFVGPNNGLFSFLVKDGVHAGRRISSDSTVKPSATFHGRDIFAPTAAKIAAGVPIESVTDADIQIVQLTEPPCLAGEGQIAYFDRFGNAITTFTQEAAGGNQELLVQRTDLHVPIATTYNDVPDAQPLAYVGSTGYIEIAVRNGNARETLDLRNGDVVRLLPPDVET